MKIAIAIEILTRYQLGDDPLYLPELPAAIAMAIEAFKAVRASREGSMVGAMYPLPGESQD